MEDGSGQLVNSDKKWHLQALTYFYKYQVKHSLANMNEVISRGGGERRSKRRASSPLGVVGFTWLSIFFYRFCYQTFIVGSNNVDYSPAFVGSRWVIYSTGRSA